MPGTVAGVGCRVRDAVGSLILEWAAVIRYRVVVVRTVGSRSRGA
jgi:hypothetical protein